MATSFYPSGDYNKQTISPRRYQIREKFFTFADNFKIKDETGQDVYTVRARSMSLTNKVTLEDMAGK